MTAWNHYWVPTDNYHLDGTTIECASSNVFRRHGVDAGDTIYPVYVFEGQLYLIGRMQVAQVVSRSEAERMLDKKVFPRAEVAVAVKGNSTLAVFDRAVPGFDGLSHMRFFPLRKATADQRRAYEKLLKE